MKSIKNLFSKLKERKKNAKLGGKNKRNLRKGLEEWVRKNLGDDYVEEALQKYDIINSGGSIGGMMETIVFIELVEQVKKEMGMK